MGAGSADFIFMGARICRIIATDDLSHSCSHRYLTPNFTFAFAFVILKVINLEMMLFRCALISVSMVFCLPWSFFLFCEQC